MSVIPIIASVHDVESAIRHGNRNPGARWYISKRLSALELSALVPADWAIVSAGLPDFLKKGDDEDGETKKCSQKDRDKDATMFGKCKEHAKKKSVTAAALTRRQARGKIGAMTAAAEWNEDLYLRDRNGRFIEKFDIIDVFPEGLAEGAGHFRGTAVGNARGDLGEDLVTVKLDKDITFAGQTIKAGTEIPVNTDQIESAPNPKARLDKKPAGPATIPSNEVVDDKAVAARVPSQKEIDAAEAQYEKNVAAKDKLKEGGAARAKAEENLVAFRARIDKMYGKDGSTAPGQLEAVPDLEDDSEVREDMAALGIDDAEYDKIVAELETEERVSPEAIYAEAVIERLVGDIDGYEDYIDDRITALFGQDNPPDVNAAALDVDGGLPDSDEDYAEEIEDGASLEEDEDYLDDAVPEMTDEELAEAAKTAEDETPLAQAVANEIQKRKAAEPTAEEAKPDYTVMDDDSLRMLAEAVAKDLGKPGNAQALMDIGLEVNRRTLDEGLSGNQQVGPPDNPAFADAEEMGTDDNPLEELRPEGPDGELPPEYLEDIAQIRDLFDVDSGLGGWASGLNDDSMNSMLSELEDYYDAPDSVSPYFRDKLDDLVRAAEQMEIDDPTDLVEARRIIMNLGWAQAEQLQAILNGEPIGSINPSAARNIADVMHAMPTSIRNHGGDHSFEELSDAIHHYLENPGPEAGDPDSPAGGYSVGDRVKIGDDTAEVVDIYNGKYPVLRYSDGTEQTVEHESISGIADADPLEDLSIQQLEEVHELEDEGVPTEEAIQAVQQDAAVEAEVQPPADPEAGAKLALMSKSAGKDSVAFGEDEATARINGILDDAGQGRVEDAHKNLAKLMTELKLGGKQRKRYRELLDSYVGSDGDNSAETQAAATAETLSDDNPVKEKLAAKAGLTLSNVDGSPGAEIKSPPEPVVQPDLSPPVVGPIAEADLVKLQDLFAKKLPASAGTLLKDSVARGDWDAVDGLLKEVSSGMISGTVGNHPEVTLSDLARMRKSIRDSKPSAPAVPTFPIGQLSGGDDMALRTDGFDQFMKLVEQSEPWGFDMGGGSNSVDERNGRRVVSFSIGGDHAPDQNWYASFDAETGEVVSSSESTGESRAIAPGVLSAMSAYIKNHDKVDLNKPVAITDVDDWQLEMLATLSPNWEPNGLKYDKALVDAASAELIRRLAELPTDQPSLAALSVPELEARQEKLQALRRFDLATLVKAEIIRKKQAGKA